MDLPWPYPAYVVLGLYVLYILFVILNVADGYAREVFSRRRNDRSHRFFWQLHTGLHISPTRSYGDEGRLKRTSAANNRMTPEGLVVHWSRRSRRGRAARNNLVVFSGLTWLGLFCTRTALTMQVTVVLVIVGVFLWVAALTAALRARHSDKAPLEAKVKQPFVRTKASRLVLNQDVPVPGSVVSVDEPTARLSSGVKPSTLATLLSSELHCSPAEAMECLRITYEQGELILPGTFAALIKQREPVQEIIEAHTRGSVKFTWTTTEEPRRLTWVPVEKKVIPLRAPFEDYADEILVLPQGELAAGLDEDGKIYVESFNGEFPWHCAAMGSGSGKSSKFRNMIAQICMKDPLAEIYCIDVKQVSFAPFRGVPGIYVFDDPVFNMRAIWDVFYELKKIMVSRYTAVREGRMKTSDFHDVWVFVDEGNELAAYLKNYYKSRLDGKAAQPPIWAEAIAGILRDGREVGIRGMFMLQDVTDRALGGESLKMAFSEFSMAAWKEQQFARILGHKPPTLLEGPGRILQVRGKKETWIQGFYADPEWFRAQCLTARANWKKAA